VNNLQPPELPDIFQNGRIELKGQFMPGSNYTFLVDVHHAGRTYPAVYKPSRGEQPLWDFPENSLAQREVAAYVVSEVLGFGFVPLTTLREEGPHGPGSLQQYIEYDPDYHYFSFTAEDRRCLKPVALFDLVCNNADRKGSHVFFENDTHKLFAIDHGLCFHTDNKLRTVIWEFGGQPIPPELLLLLGRVEELRAPLKAYLSPREIGALVARAQALLRSGTYPFQPGDRRAYPYPPL
jgi:uncharacterized repeat protein (TIGR03843 family)